MSGFDSHISPQKLKGEKMIPIEAIIGLGMVAWYITWTIILVKNQKKQTALQEKQNKILNEISMTLSKCCKDKE
jgi:hypothetical protein